MNDDVQAVDPVGPAGPSGRSAPAGAPSAAGCCGGGSDHAPESDHGRHGDPGYHGSKTAYMRRLKLIEGQVRGLHRMVEDDTYCIDVLTQVSAVTKALQSVAVGLVDDHVHHCVHAAAQSGDSAELDRKMEEIMSAVKRLMK